MNKKILLLVFICCSTKVFADFGLGFNAYANWSDRSHIRNVTEWGFGGDLAFGDMKGRPLIFQVSGNSFSSENAQVKINLDWHVLPLNIIGLLQLFLGVGVGTTLNFDPSQLSSDHDVWADNINPIIYGRFPIGLKVFLSKVEIFLSIAPQAGWDISPNSFYWSFEAGTGVRIWF